MATLYHAFGTTEFFQDYDVFWFPVFETPWKVAQMTGDPNPIPLTMLTGTQQGLTVFVSAGVLVLTTEAPELPPYFVRAFPVEFGLLGAGAVSALALPGGSLEEGMHSPLFTSLADAQTHSRLGQPPTPLTFDTGSLQGQTLYRPGGYPAMQGGGVFPDAVFGFAFLNPADLEGERRAVFGLKTDAWGFWYPLLPTHVLAMLWEQHSRAGLFQGVLEHTFINDTVKGVTFWSGSTVQQAEESDGGIVVHNPDDVPPTPSFQLLSLFGRLTISDQKFLYHHPLFVKMADAAYHFSTAEFGIEHGTPWPTNKAFMITTAVTFDAFSGSVANLSFWAGSGFRSESSPAQGAQLLNAGDVFTDGFVYGTLQDGTAGYFWPVTTRNIGTSSIVLSGGSLDGQTLFFTGSMQEVRASNSSPGTSSSITFLNPSDSPAYAIYGSEVGTSTALRGYWYPLYEYEAAAIEAGGSASPVPVHINGFGTWYFPSEGEAKRRVSDAPPDSVILLNPNSVPTPGNYNDAMNAFKVKLMGAIEPHKQTVPHDVIVALLGGQAPLPGERPDQPVNFEHWGRLARLAFQLHAQDTPATAERSSVQVAAEQFAWDLWGSIHLASDDAQFREAWDYALHLCATQQSYFADLGVTF